MWKLELRETETVASSQFPLLPVPKRPVGLKLQIGWPHLAYFDLRGVRGQRSFGFQTALWEMGARRHNQPRSHNQAYNVIQKGKHVWRWKWADPKWYWRPYPFIPIGSTVLMIGKFFFRSKLLPLLDCQELWWYRWKKDNDDDDHVCIGDDDDDEIFS